LGKLRVLSGAEVCRILTNLRERAHSYNRSRRHAIKKLEGIAAGDGQYRLRSPGFDSDTMSQERSST
jgi:hypothetical protein